MLLFFLFLRFGGTLQLFFIYFTFTEHTCNILYIILVDCHSWTPHCFCSVEGLLWGVEQRFELGPATQQADALLSEPRRTLLSHAAPSEPRRTLRATPHPICYPISIILFTRINQPYLYSSYWLFTYNTAYWGGDFSLITLIKKKIKFSSYRGKFREEQLQSHIWGRAS